MVPWKNEIPRFYHGGEVELKGPSGVAGPASAGSAIPNMGPLGHREKGSATQSGRDSHILESKRNIECRHRLAPSHWEGETQEPAGPPSPLKDSVQGWHCIATQLEAGVHSGDPSLSGPPRSCGELPCHRLPGDSWGAPSEGCWSRKGPRQESEGGPRPPPPPAHLGLLVWAAAAGGLTPGS